MTELDDLLDRVEAPDVSVGDDVARGRRALRRRRGWQTVTSGVAVAGVAGAVAVLPSHHGSATVGPASSTTYTGTHSSTRAGSGGVSFGKHPSQREKRWQQEFHATLAAAEGYRAILLSHLDPAGSLVGDQPGGDGGYYAGRPGRNSVTTSVGWIDGGLVVVTVADSWANASDGQNGQNFDLKPTTFRGHQARVATTPTDMEVLVKNGDTYVGIIVSTNNGSSHRVSDLGVTQEQVLATAADTRFALPDPMPTDKMPEEMSNELTMKLSDPRA
jgi:hypothetical protein